MTRGRNTTVIKIRLPDTVIAQLRKRADRAGIGYTTLARHLIQEKMGLPKT